jgi:hypothetical protein
MSMERAHLNRMKGRMDVTANGVPELLNVVRYEDCVKESGEFHGTVQ